MAGAREDRSQPASVTITCRVTPEQKQQVIEWAQAAGRDVSDFVRAAIFQETHATAEALEAVRREVDQAARSDAGAEIGALQASLTQERERRVAWQQRAQQLEQRLLFTSRDLLDMVSRVRFGRPAARVEVARLWACMPVSHRLLVLPAVATQALEWIERLQTKLVTVPWLLPTDFAVLENVFWLKETLDPCAGLQRPEVPQPTPEWAPVMRALRDAYELLQQRPDVAAGHSTTRSRNQQ
jgi:uncharacterized protein (DUF1778 family)